MSWLSGSCVIAGALLPVYVIFETEPVLLPLPRCR